ncbi:MAG: hypothetical protein M0P71_09325 [Melioribacteraceae bacterium]|nr:hypothetical protein [Melioribacteraceae bacterium]
MKSLLFTTAIIKRLKVSFIFGAELISLEPYYISKNKNGEKVVFGRINNLNEIRVFEYNKIFNLRLLEQNRFSPLIPILPVN